MMVRFGCKRFDRLSSDALDRALTPSESLFMDSHRSECDLCRRAEATGALALNMLRSSALQAETDDAFDRRVARKVRVQSARDRFAYWSPSAIGALVAAVLVIAVVQLVSSPQKMRENSSPVGEARLMKSYVPAIPDIQSEP